MSPAQKVNAESDREKRRVRHRVKYARDLEQELFRLIALTKAINRQQHVSKRRAAQLAELNEQIEQLTIECAQYCA